MICTSKAMQTHQLQRGNIFTTLRHKKSICMKNDIYMNMLHYVEKYVWRHLICSTQGIQLGLDFVTWNVYQMT